MDPVRPLIRKLVIEDELTAERVLDEIRAVGYRGAYTILKEEPPRSYIRTFRPKSMRRAHERFETAPGEQAQVDLSFYTVMLGLMPTKVPKMYSLNSEASILPRRMSAAAKRWRSS